MNLVDVALLLLVASLMTAIVLPGIGLAVDCDTASGMFFVMFLLAFIYLGVVVSFGNWMYLRL